LKEFVEIYVNENEKIFTYAVPEIEQPAAEIGCAVNITVKNKECTGYILRFVEKPSFKTLPLTKITDKPQFTESLAKLVFWLAEYYKCFPETAVKLILPKE
jgi:primosomal protein N' (replication factor Y)